MKDVAFIIIITSVMSRETFFTLPCLAPRLLFRLALDIMFGMPRTFCTFNCLSSVRSWVATFKTDPSGSVRWTTKSTLHLVFFLLFPRVCAALHTTFPVSAAECNGQCTFIPLLQSSAWTNLTCVYVRAYVCVCMCFRVQQKVLLTWTVTFFHILH